MLIITSRRIEHALDFNLEIRIWRHWVYIECSRYLLQWI